MYRRRVDPLVNDADPAPVALGIEAALEFGRRLPPIGGLQPQHVDRVAGADAHAVGRAGRELGIEIEIAVARTVEELEIAEQRNLRPAILDIENLPPTVVTGD